MSNLARVKKLAGQVGSSPNSGIPPTIASATTIVLPENAVVVYISGTTAISTIQCDRIRPNRRVVLIFTSTASLTDTAYGTTYLTPNTTTANICTASISPGAGTTVELMQDQYGQWLSLGASVNG